MCIDRHGGGLRFVADRSVGRAPEERRATRFLLHTLRGPRKDIYLRFEDGGEKSLRLVLEGARELLGPDARMHVPPRPYDRIVDDVDPAGLPPQELCERLGRAMEGGGPASVASRSPAAFTYLGQFIAHDMTHMRLTGAAVEPQNIRSHALDLDSLFDAVPAGCAPAGPVQCDGGVCLGQTTLGRFEDLPRAADGTPCIPDRRNDNNVAVSQLTVALGRFHQIVCQVCGTADPEEQKRITRRHVQSVVLHDYLRSVCHDAVYDDILLNGRRIVHPPGSAGPFLVPIEFAAACFRFGHSQVRDVYDWNADHTTANSNTIRRLSHFGVAYSLVPRLPDHWVADWSRLQPGPGAGPDRFTAAIDTRLAEDLLSLERGWIDINPAEPEVQPGELFVSLAALTLARGRALELPTGQQLQSHVAAQLSAGAPEAAAVNGADIIGAGTPFPAGGLSTGEIATLQEATPLWFYTLREADWGGGGGQHLGPLASRIVMETIHAAIEAAPDNIVSGPAFQVHPALAAGGGAEFRFSDLVACVQQHAPT